MAHSAHEMREMFEAGDLDGDLERLQDRRRPRSSPIRRAMRGSMLVDKLGPPIWLHAVHGVDPDVDADVPAVGDGHPSRSHGRVLDAWRPADGQMDLIAALAGQRGVRIVVEREACGTGHRIARIDAPAQSIPLRAGRDLRGAVTSQRRETATTILVEGLWMPTAVIEWVGQAIQCVPSGHGRRRGDRLPRPATGGTGAVMGDAHAAVSVLPPKMWRSPRVPEAMAPAAQIDPIGPGPSPDAPRGSVGPRIHHGGRPGS